MKTFIDIDPEWTVNETLSRIPAAARVFGALGIDTCCGGGASIAEAAREAQLDRGALVAAITDAARETEG